MVHLKLFLATINEHSCRFGWDYSLAKRRPLNWKVTDCHPLLPGPIHHTPTCHHKRSFFKSPSRRLLGVCLHIPRQTVGDRGFLSRWPAKSRLALAPKIRAKRVSSSRARRAISGQWYFWRVFTSRHQGHGYSLRRQGLYALATGRSGPAAGLGEARQYRCSNSWWSGGRISSSGEV